ISQKAGRLPFPGLPASFLQASRFPSSLPSAAPSLTLPLPTHFLTLEPLPPLPPFSSLFLPPPPSDHPTSSPPLTLPSLPSLLSSPLPLPPSWPSLPPLRRPLFPQGLPPPPLRPLRAPALPGGYDCEWSHWPRRDPCALGRRVHVPLAVLPGAARLLPARPPSARCSAVSGRGTRTIVPDFFVGQEPWDPSGDWSIFPEWLKTRNARKIDREIDAVLKYLKQQCHAQKIGLVGFCWGGIAVHNLMMKYSEFRAGVSVYGIVKDSEDIYNLKNPTLFIFAENDAVIPLENVSLLTQKLKEHCKVEYQIKTFSGQTHGFVHRKREDCSPADKPYIDEARRNLIEWLNKYM
uniref:Carboxymethylenebutenolidase homolog n=2 Tax=Callitrichinae TaxID=9480 RepID=A0A8I3WZG3_CALJA